jgi:hypothetical protein
VIEGTPHARTIRCLDCGAVFAQAIRPCQHCGGTVELSVGLTGVESKGQVGQLGTVNDARTPDGDQRIRYSSPVGSRSESSVRGDRMRVEVAPPVDVGRRGESRVIACIQAMLAREGRRVILRPAVDAQGEDAVLQIDGEPGLAVQIVTPAPGNPAFWGKVARGKAAAIGEIAEAIDWIHSAIRDKAARYPKEDRQRMLLALDLVHLGVLCDARFGAEYLRHHGDPAALFGFASVWLVGPTEDRLLRLGNSRW